MNCETRAFAEISRLTRYCPGAWSALTELPFRVENPYQTVSGIKAGSPFCSRTAFWRSRVQISVPR